MSDDGLPERPEQAALAELRRLVHHLGEELAGYRKRALGAEARLKALADLSAKSGLEPERVFELERENAELKTRLEAARARTKALLERVRFLRQQHEGV